MGYNALKYMQEAIIMNGQDKIIYVVYLVTVTTVSSLLILNIMTAFPENGTISWSDFGAVIAGLGTIALVLISCSALSSWREEHIGKEELSLRNEMLRSLYRLESETDYAIDLLIKTKDFELYFIIKTVDSRALKRKDLAFDIQEKINHIENLHRKITEIINEYYILYGFTLYDSSCHQHLTSFLKELKKQLSFSKEFFEGNHVQLSDKVFYDSRMAQLQKFLTKKEYFPEFERGGSHNSSLYDVNKEVHVRYRKFLRDLAV